MLVSERLVILRIVSLGDKRRGMETDDSLPPATQRAIQHAAHHNEYEKGDANVNLECLHGILLPERRKERTSL